ncbi:MAG: right-handed parallel beta-helix repeat-containing protein, partial [Myxococcota bacterium]|nr:right-handed parallel beta-helix repeat-containing protein [Myxococcota bacterium]
GSAKGVFVTGGNAAWTVSGNQVNGSQSGVPPGPMIGFGFANLGASASVNFTDNTIANAGLTGLGFLNCLADVLVDDNDIYGTWSDSGGNHPRQYVGVGVLIIDSSGIEVSNNVLRDNAYAAILIDLSESEEASVIVRSNTTSNNGAEEESTDVVQQNVPETASVTVSDSGNERQNQAEERIPVSREVERPPRCGNNVLEVGETCDGEALCNDQCTFQPGFASVAAGKRHFCALDLNGRLHCMGRNDHGEIALEPLANPYRSVFEEISGNHRLLAGPFEAVSAGQSHSCAMSPLKVVCWGDNGNGQLGNGDLQTNGPLLIAGLQELPENPFVELVSALNHNCVRRELGEVYCWGANDHLGTVPQPALQRDASGGQPLRALRIWAGTENLCARVADNAGDKLICWGSDANAKRAINDGNGVESNSDQPNSDEPVRKQNLSPLTNVDAVAIGTHHICAVSEGALYCWGASEINRLGLPFNMAQATATEVLAADGSPFTSVATSQTFDPDFQLGPDAPELAPLTCGLRRNGEALCFGSSNHNLLRDGEIKAQAPTEALPDLGLSAAAIALGQGKACALNPSDKSLNCWGNDNFFGPAVNGFHAPKEVLIPEVPVDLKMSRSYALVLSDSGNIYQWGRTVDQRTVGQGVHEVERVNNGQPVRSIGAARDAICYRDDNGVSCMGSFGDLPLGNGREFVSIGGSHSPGTEIACGDQHCCTSSGFGVSCWGNNLRGQLGEGIGGNTFAVTAFDERMVYNLAVGANHSCALVATEGGMEGVSVLCWGDNQRGQLGMHVSDSSASPVETYSTAEQLITMGSGGDSVCVTQEIGLTTSLMCWGDNQVGQLGVDPVAGDVLPNFDF